MSLKPFFSYYGCKWRAVGHYPKPTRKRINEPFAGAAGYATRYPHHDVLLIDANPRIAALWTYLIGVSSAEILALPSMVDHVDTIRAPQEARDLIGFWVNAGASSPHKTPSKWMRQRLNDRGGFWGEAIRQRIASQVEQIRHWRVLHGSYETARDEPATWFVDPPYSTPAGSKYPTRFDRFDELATWCRSRVGQVIVCEQLGATWLPFMPLTQIRSSYSPKRAALSSEVIWTNGL